MVEKMVQCLVEVKVEKLVCCLEKMKGSSLAEKKVARWAIETVEVKERLMAENSVVNSELQ
jgi:hypothetical protein